MSENGRSRKLNTGGARQGSGHLPTPAGQHRTVSTAHSRSGSGSSRNYKESYQERWEEPRPRRSEPPRKKHKKKKKHRVLKALMAMTLVLALGLGGVYIWVVRSISPIGGTPSIPELIQTPQEYKGDVVNVLVCGIDFEEGRDYSDSATNDGMTDMIMYVSFDVANKKVSMMQIPRNVVVGSLAPNTNGQINSVALAGGGISALAQAVHDQLKLTVDEWVTIDMDSLRAVVNVFGGVWVNVPHDISYNGSTIYQGYRKLDGDAAAFFVRNRKGEGYQNSDLDRLMMQRYFYQGLLKELRLMTIWDAAKMVPVAARYAKTSMDTSTIVSLAVSLLKVDSANIMLCRMPVYQAAQYYNNNSVLVADPAGTAQLLNQYFRTYSGPVPEEDLNLFPWPTTGSAFDPNVQFMGQLDTESQQAQATGTPE